MGLVLKINADSDILLHIGFNKPNKIYNLTNLIKRQFDFSLNQTNTIYLYADIENYPITSYINFINNNYVFEYYLFDTNDFGIINYYISLEETGIIPDITDSHFVLNKNNNKGLILKINSDSDIHLNIGFNKPKEIYNLTSLEERSFNFSLNQNDKINLFVDISEYPKLFYINLNNKNFEFEYHLFETNDFRKIKYYSSIEERGIIPNISDFSFSLAKINNKSIGLVLKIDADCDIFLHIGFSKPNKIYNLTNLIKRQFDFSLNQTNTIYLYADIENYPIISYIYFINENYMFEYYLFETNDFGKINYYISFEEMGVIPIITDSYFSLSKNNNKGLILKITADSDIHLNIRFGKTNEIYNLTTLEKRIFDHPLNQNDTIKLFVDISEYPNLFYINFINGNFDFEYYLFETNDFRKIQYYSSLEETGIVPIIIDSYFSLNRRNNEGLILKINTDSDIHLNVGFNKPSTIYNLTSLEKKTFYHLLNQNDKLNLFVDISEYPNLF